MTTKYLNLAAALALAFVAVLGLVLGLASTRALAHCNEEGVHSGSHPHCNPDSGPETGKYEVETTGPTDLVFATYVGEDGGGRSSPVHVNFQFLAADMTFFEGQYDDRGENCFDGSPIVNNLTAMTISEAKDGTAAVQFWFTGYADNGTTEVGYLLGMDGTFDGVWPPTAASATTATLDSWGMSINNTGGVKKIACTKRDGVMYTQIKITRIN